MKRLLILLLLSITTISYGQVVILNEDFSTAAGTTAPDKWSNIPASSVATDLWHFDNPGNIKISYPLISPFAILDAAKLSTDSSINQVILETPYFDATVGKFTLLFFDHDFDPGNGGTAEVQAWDGKEWVAVLSLDSTTNMVRKEYLDITSYVAGRTTGKVRFLWKGKNSGYWAIDNIKIIAPLKLDAGISHLDIPSAPYSAGSKQFKVRLFNYGYDTIQSARINWTVNGAEQPSILFENQSISFGRSKDSLLLGSYTFNDGSLYNIGVWSSLPNGLEDNNNFNDTLRINIQIPAAPLPPPVPPVPGSALCGIYYIGGTNPDFKTIKDAVHNLNTGGVTCPVVLKIRNGTYFEQLVIDSIKGSSAINTVTFESETSDSTKVIITSQIPNSTTIILNGTRNIIFKKIGVKTDGYGSTSVIITNNSKNVIITNCDISNYRWFDTGINIGGNSVNVSLINSFLHNGNGNHRIFVGVSDNIIISGNKIENSKVSNGIHSTGGFTKMLISDNKFNLSGGNGIYISFGSDTLTIDGNLITGGGINLKNNSVNGQSFIRNNQIRWPSGSGIILSTINSAIYNNFISTGGLYGIEASNCTNAKILFNNVYVTNKNLNAGALYLNGGNNLIINNNIFFNPFEGYAVYVNSIPTGCSWDYNNYFSNYKKTAFLAGVSYKSFSDWANAIKGELNGQNCFPFYTSNIDLSPHHVLLNNSGFPFPEVTKDIISVPRTLLAPDISAKEFTPCNQDAGINEVVVPETPADTSEQEVKVILQNHGTDNLTSAIIYWQLIGGTVNQYAWNGSLQYKENTIVTVGRTSIPGKINYIKAWTSKPNNGPDCDNYNDTIVSPKIVTRLCGTYTIGGSYPNFISLTDANWNLAHTGITCPVTFLIREGSYNEQLVIDTVHGSSPINTVTFESETHNTSKTIINYTGTGDPTIILNAAENINFRYLDLVKFVLNGAKNINVNNCYLATSNNIGIYIQANSNTITVDSSYIEGNGKLGLLVNQSNNIRISGNTIHNSLFQLSNALKNIYVDNNNLNICPFSISFTGDSLFITNNKVNTGFITASSNNANGLFLLKGNRINTNIFYASSPAYSQALTLNKINKGEVINNYVTFNGVNQGNGISLSACTNTEILFNNINVQNSNQGSNAIYINGGSNLSIRNNIFFNPFEGFDAYVASNPASTSWDYNNYFSNYKKTAWLSGVTYTTFSDWAKAISGEAGGLSCFPFYSGNTDLTPNQILLNNKGLSLQPVSTDIDSIIRTPDFPDIGAKEFSPCSNDAGVNAVLFPETPADTASQDVKVVLQNQGLETLTSVTIYWQLNGLTQEPFTWTGTLATAQNEEVIVGRTSMPGKINFIKAWTTDPNNGSDCNHLNDTIISPKIVTRLCGIYTIGGTKPNFKNVSDAVWNLNKTGISCPVTFKIREANFNEQLVIGTIQGSSKINTVTFESETHNTAKTIINYTATSDPSITLNATENINFRYLDLVKFVLNGAKNVNVNNCYLATSNNIGIYIQGNSKSITVDSSYIEGNGGLGFLIRQSANINVQNNKFNRSILQTDNALHKIVISNNNLTSSYIGTGSFTGDSIFILNNKFSSGYIRLTSNGNNGYAQIQSNIINNSGSTGIQLSSVRNFNIINNLISISGSSSNVNGIDFNGNQSLLAFNSINLFGSTSESQNCLKISGNSLNIKNNILSNSGSGYCVVQNGTSTGSSWDYNDYFSISEKIGSINGSSYYSFPAWAGIIVGESNGKHLNPYFINGSGYRHYQRVLNGAGIPIPGVKLDIEGMIRNDQAPDIGAWEFMVDFGVEQIISPPLSCTHGTADSVKILLRQYGDIPFTDIKLAYQVNGGAVVHDTIKGTIFNDLVYTFHTPVDISALGTYVIKSWLENNYDDNVNNDTLSVIRYSSEIPFADFSYSGKNQNTPITFEAVASVGPPYTISGYEWDFGDGSSSDILNPEHTYSESGIYKVIFRAYNNTGCAREIVKEITIEEYELLGIITSVNNSGCDTKCNGSIDIEITGGRKPFRYFLNGNASSATPGNLCAGSYTVKVIDTDGFEISDTVSIETVSPINIKISADQRSGNVPFTASLHAIGNGASTYQWIYDGKVFSTSPSAEIKLMDKGYQLITLIAKGPEPYQCEASDTIHLYVDYNVKIEIPKAFTPNGDGYNDTFGPLTIGIKDLEMKIVNRNGRLVHTITGVGGRWDGFMPSGKAAPQGVYFYTMKALGYDGLAYNRKGSVSLYRGHVSFEPNPVVSEARLDISGRFEGERRIGIFNSSGTLLKQWNTSEDLVSLDLSWLEPGFYIIKASNNQNEETVKFIKE